MGQARAKVATKQKTDLRRLTFASLAMITLAFGATLANAQDKIIKSHGISTFGDLKYPADFKHWDYVNPDAPQGGTISFLGTGASGTFDSLNPFILKGTPAQGLGLMHSSLLTGSGDEPDSAYGYIAETLEYPEDRQWVIFNMRPEATFSDGEPITADEVVFSYEILMEKGHPVYQIIYKDIEKVEALEPHRVKFTFKEGVNTRDLPAQAGGITILPRHYYETKDFGESTIDVPVTSGGFTATDIKPGRSIKYCKIDNYWAKDLPHNKGSGNFDCYLYEYFTDRTVALEAFKAGSFLFHEEFTSKNWANSYNFPAINKGHVIKETIPDDRPSGTQGFWINMRQDKFADPRVRQAIGMMFNFEWSNKTLFYGLYERTDSFWENSNMQAEGVPTGKELALLEEFRDQLPENIFTEEPFTPAVSRPSQTDRKAVRAAGKLLDEAGWKVVNGKRTNDKGEVLTLELVDDSPAFERIINPYIENLKRLGIDASYKLIDAAQMQERQKNFDYDLIPGRLSMDLSPGEDLAQIFGTKGAETLGSSNYSGIKDPVVDALIIKIAQAETREDMQVAVRALDRVMRNMHIWVPNWYKGSHNIAYWDVFGRPDTKPLYSRGVIGTWWLDQEKLDALKAEGALR
ncbi:extracellular solute-binding protein [Amylibacter sp. IMCC11727]|uniref:extracellular solute-binding protein n=1 Tax=Amylibacter sp. IMCC11727 TaxID=3039851 RepID=UPI00244E5A0E|nr:extracellular solute-binding protein [Amylibacter sp. IMCC11727]WGI21482.1 extracellular solute-binding protein [Amylibacter sp. IMCC11727]